jgi:hypothetical protein
VRCQECDRDAELRYTLFRSNIGMVLARQERTIEGLLCDECIARSYRTAQTTNLAAGWWGGHSLVCTPMFLAGNWLVRKVGLRLTAVPAGGDEDDVEAFDAREEGRALRDSSSQFGMATAVVFFGAILLLVGAVAAGASRSRGPTAPDVGSVLAWSGVLAVVAGACTAAATFFAACRGVRRPPRAN